MSQKKVYTREFKDSAIQLALEGSVPASKIAVDLGISDNTLYNWIRNYRVAHALTVNNRQEKKPFTDIKSSPKETLEEENRRLRAENKILRQEREILKKATAYFAKETL